MGLVDGSDDISLSLAAASECPDRDPKLQPWSPGHNQDHRVHIGRGRTLLLTSSATVHSIHITDGGKLVSPPLSAPPRPHILEKEMQAGVASGGQKQRHVLQVRVRASGGLQ